MTWCHCLSSSLCFVGYFHFLVSGSAWLSHTGDLCPWLRPSRDPDCRGRVSTSAGDPGTQSTPGATRGRTRGGPGGRPCTGSLWSGARTATPSTSTRRSTRQRRATRSWLRMRPAPTPSSPWLASRGGDTSSSMGGLTGTTAVIDINGIIPLVWRLNN